MYFPSSRIIQLIRFRLHDYEVQGMYSNPVQYYDFLQNRVMIVFKPKYEETDAEHPEFHLTLSKKHNYDIVRRTNAPRHVSRLKVLPVRCLPRSESG